jgi:acylphosphatase
MKHAFNAIVHGIVQGVAFRHYTRLAASDLKLAGFVRNLPNGTVEVLAEGEEEALKKLVNWLDRGPPSAHVSKVDVFWVEPKGKYDSFIITY